MMEHFEYPISLMTDPEGGYIVTCRDLPELITQGESLDDALNQATDAMEEVFASYMKSNREFPTSSKVKRGEYLIAPPAGIAAKVALYVTMRETHVSKTQLAQRLGVDEKEVRRLLDPHHPSKLPRIAEAIKLLGKRLVIGLEMAEVAQ